MTEENISKIRQNAEQALLEGNSGPEIAIIFKVAELTLQQAEEEMQTLGFFALAIATAEEQKLYVSNGISQPGIATLALNLGYKKQPSIDWK